MVTTPAREGCAAPGFTAPGFTARVPWVGGEQVLPAPHSSTHWIQPTCPLNSCCMGLTPSGRAPPLNVKSLMTVRALPSHQTPRVRHSPVSTSPSLLAPSAIRRVLSLRGDRLQEPHSPKGTDHAPSNVHQAAAVPQTGVWVVEGGRAGPCPAVAPLPLMRRLLQG